MIESLIRFDDRQKAQRTVENVRGERSPRSSKIELFVKVKIIY